MPEKDLASTQANVNNIQSRMELSGFICSPHKTDIKLLLAMPKQRMQLAAEVEHFLVGCSGQPFRGFDVGMSGPPVTLHSAVVQQPWACLICHVQRALTAH